MMNRPTAWLAALLLFLPLSLPLPAAAQQLKLAYVSTERILRDSKAAQKAQKGLEAEALRREKEIAGRPANEQDRRRTALAEDMAQKRDDVLKQLIENANAAIKRIAEQGNYDAVFFEAAYASSRIDITDQVIKALDAGK